MISVNLHGHNDALIAADICGQGNPECGPFVTFDVGPLSVILATPEQARKLAAALHRAADKYDALPAETKLIAARLNEVAF